MNCARALLLWAWALCPSLAAADSTTLAPTYAEAQQATHERTAARLEQTLRSWPDVTNARVHIAGTDASRVALDQPLPPARVSAWLELQGSGPSDASVRALLASATPDTTPESIRIVRHARKVVAHAQVVLTNVGPFRVAPESAAWLRVLLSTLLASNVGLCTILLARLRRNARTT